MRPFEALLLCAAGAAILRGCLPVGSNWPDWSPAMPLVIVVLLGLHLTLEGWRPEMLGAYAAIVLLLPLIPAPALAGLLPRLLGGAGGLLMLGATAGLCVLRPVIVTPVPTGALAVGTALVPLFADRGDGSPGLRVWYPARRGTGTGPAPYLIERRAQGRRRLRLSRDRAEMDAAPVEGPARMPILVFFPGWGCLPSQNTVLLQDLASHGYVVAAPDAWDPAAYPGDGDAAADLVTPLVFDPSASLAVAARAARRNAVRQARLARQVLDRLTSLDRLDPDARFTGRLDLDHAGVLGFSFGGSVAIQAALDEPRFRAVANLDGGVFTDAYARGFKQPYLMITEGVSSADLRSPDPAVRGEATFDLWDDANMRSFLDRNGGMVATIRNVAHVNFQDAPLLQPWGRNGRRLGGSIGPQRARLVVDDLLLAFFGRLLRGQPSPTPAHAARAYSDVILRIWPSTLAAAD